MICDLLQKGMTQIAYSTAAIRALARIPASIAKTIRAKIGQYAANPESLANNVKRLQGRPGYRLRVGNYRVIFDRDGNVLNILEIGPRGSVYGD